MIADAVDKLRRAIQNEVPKGDKAPLFRTRRKLRKGTKKLTLRDRSLSVSFLVPLRSLRRVLNSGALSPLGTSFWIARRSLSTASAIMRSMWKRSPELIDRVRDHALDVEAVAHDRSVRQRGPDRSPVGLVHVDADLFDRRPGGLGQSREEVLQGPPFAGLYELQHTPAIGVRDGRVVDLAA